MIVIVIMVVAIAAILVGSLSYSALNSARQERTSSALAQAKDALLGRAASDDNMPGSLPCPDTNNDGDEEPISGNVCPNYIGRLPWRTLQLPDLRDGSGERLWYALSPDFRKHDPINPTPSPLNSDTKGTLLVYDTNGTSLLTQPGYSAVAAIFAPGSPLGPQTRNTVAERNSAANYLDADNGRDNSIVGPGFIAGNKSDVFNDRLLFITTKELMPLVEQRVAGVVKVALDTYYATNGYYPWADLMGASIEYNSDYGLSRGWLPKDASSNSGSTHPNPPNWVPGSLPSWFDGNQWYTLIYYSVARNYTSWPADCSSCGNPTLIVNGTDGTRVLFFMPGTPIGTLTRTINNLSDYLEDPANNDNPGNDSYSTPASTAFDRDRLYWFTGTWKP